MTTDLALREQVVAILGDLRRELGARRASVVPKDGVDPPLGGTGGLRTLPLGGGARLEVELGPMGRGDETVDGAIERAARALRELTRAAGRPLPAADALLGAVDRPTLTRDRIHGFLAALASIQGADNALCVVDGAIVSAARPPTELESDRADLLIRRTIALARSQRQGHTDLADPDAFVLTFWHHAALVLYFAGPYAVDFVRHRARQVARELAGLLPDLEPDPAAPAATLLPP